MVIKDATGCTYLETAKITEPGPLSIDLENDVTITLGENRAVVTYWSNTRQYSKPFNGR